MKNVISRFCIQVGAASSLFVGASSAYAGNVNLGISFGSPFYMPTPIVYASPTYASLMVVHGSPAMTHKPYRGYRPRGPIYGKAHAAPPRYNIAPRRHDMAQQGRKIAPQRHNMGPQRHIEGHPAQARHNAPQYQDQQQRSHR